MYDTATDIAPRIVAEYTGGTPVGNALRPAWAPTILHDTW